MIKYLVIKIIKINNQINDNLHFLWISIISNKKILININNIKWLSI